ncbi:hypothetical protein [Hymenobacter fodinae]|uniref:Uncharacterized protein n=1 Tax=Hymenobacter fodinae TaxID=2510796 RepID=A0A4Z0PBV9_9BACT|nr:hypothetical protein [Hymenobacter fodinae]TGE10125.1 hypothetical protein EU556_04695 [Hymenobacter fodinae]
MTNPTADTWRVWLGAVTLFVLFSGMYLWVTYGERPENHSCANRIGQLDTLDQQAYRVVQELLGQSNAQPEAESVTTFYVGKMLTETMRQPSLANPRPPQTPALDEATLLELHTKYQVLRAEDLPYMRQQTTRSANFRLRPQWVPSYSIMPADTASALYKKYGADWFSLPVLQKRYPITHLFSLSKPLLSCDGQTAIVEIDYRCGGKCGLERIWVLQRRNGKWYKAKELGHTIY